MLAKYQPETHRRDRTPARARQGGWPTWARWWLVGWTLASGALALLWLLLRSGTKPSRLAYPCQQAALATTTAAFGVPVVAAALGLRRRVIVVLRTTTGKTLAGMLIAVGLFALASASWEVDDAGVVLSPPNDYRPQIFSVRDARGIEPGRFGGVDDLITLMGTHGLKWHRSDAATLTAGPDGLIAAADVVLIKINAQWTERGGTNTDVLRGVIRRVVEHPDGFAGEVIVAENTQDYRVDWTRNNAEEPTQSPQEVVGDFVTEGWLISTELWDDIRDVSVAEYSTGDLDDGYVVDSSYDPQTGIKVSYPKFESAFGSYVSYKHGVWSPDRRAYDPDRLVVINIPVLKTHRWKAVTASVKNHMGVVTTALGTNSHARVEWGGMGSFLADVRLPDLTILDCIWILAMPGEGPSSSNDQATHRNQLLAGADPIALDMWAVKYVLIPEIIANGYSYDDYHLTQDPDNPDSLFRRCTDRSMSELLLVGVDTTNDYTAVRLHVWGGDADRDGDVDAGDYAAFPDCLSGPDDLVLDCGAFDFDADGFVDLRDFGLFQQLFTGPGA